MIVISWNIRGLNSKGKQRYFKERITQEIPQMVPLQETKVSAEHLEEIGSIMKPRYEFMVIHVNRSTGVLQSYEI